MCRLIGVRDPERIELDAPVPEATKEELDEQGQVSALVLVAVQHRQLVSWNHLNHKELCKYIINFEKMKEKTL